VVAAARTCRPVRVHRWRGLERCGRLGRWIDRPCTLRRRAGAQTRRRPPAGGQAGARGPDPFRLSEGKEKGEKLETVTGCPARRVFLHATPCRAVPGARAARATFVRGRRGRVVGVSFGALGRGACVVLCSVWFRRAALLVMILQFQHSTFFICSTSQLQRMTSQSQEY